MRWFLSILFLLPFAVLADGDSFLVDPRVECVQIAGGGVRCYVVQDGQSPDDVGTNEIVMTKANCESLRAILLSYVDSIDQSCDNATNMINSAYSTADYIDSLLVDASGDLNNASSLASDYNDTLLNNAISNGREGVTDSQYRIVGIKGELNSARDSVLDIKSLGVGVRSAIEAVDCRDSTCSGSSDNLSCPCAEEFDAIIDRLDGSERSLLVDILHTNMVIAVRLNAIWTSVTNIQDNLVKIVTRLNAPDDRMWSELNRFVERLGTNYLSQIRTGQYDLSTIFYDLKNFITGHDGSRPVSLTTEGVLSLYGLTASMFNYALQADFLRHFDIQFGQFSNTVYGLYDNYLRSVRSNNMNNLRYSLGNNARSQWMYSAATNFNIAPYTKYQYLTDVAKSSLTNWFSRMEYYQQVALGWYEDRDPESTLTDAQPKQQTSIGNMLDDGTNSIGGISSALVSSSNVLYGVVSPVSRSIRGASLSVSLPSRVVLFPDVTIMDYDMEFYIDTSEISEYCNQARDITKLLWVVGFWVFCVVGIGVVVKTGIKAALWLIKYISETS